MASEVKLPEPLEEKKASHEVIDLQAINKFDGTQNIKEQLELKSSVVDENIVNEDVDLVKEDITEKPETLEEELKEKEEQKHEDAPSPIAETSTEEQEKINGEIENGVHSNQFTEELLPEVLRADEIPANGTSSSSEEIQEKSDKELSNVEKIDSEEVSKEDAPQSQIPENAEDDKDVIQSDTATLSDKDCHKEAEIPVGDEKQDAEECVTAEVEIPSATTPLVIEEVSAEAEGKNDILEEVEQEQIHQNEVAKENLAEEKDCRDETEDKSRGVSKTLTAEETIPEEASRENQAPEMTSEETAKNEEISAEAETDETGPTDNEETTPHEDSSSNSNDFPNTNEENRKGNKETTHLAEEDKGSAEINEEIKEEAQQNQIAEGYEIDMEASQSTPGTDLSESEHQNETEKEIENASADPEEQNTDTVDSKEVESTSVSEEVSKEEKESVAEEVQNEQAADETCAEEECPPDAGIQNTDPVELVVSGETMPEEAFPESKTPDPEMQISEEVKPTEDSIGVTEKDETSENDKEEDATEVPRKPDEYSEHISDESAVENAVSRDVTPEIETTDAEKTVAAETDNMDVKKIENEDEEKQNSEEVEPSESSPAPIKIEEATPNDCEEEKQGDDKIEHIETNDEQEIESCLETEEKLEESKPSTSGEELSSARETIETEPIEEKADEENVAQDEIMLDSKETVGNDDQVANCDEKGDETREINSAGEHNTNDGIKEDEEANKENVEEIPEPTKPSDGTEESTTAEVPREAIQPETENDVPSELTKGEEVLPETVSEGTVLSEMETEKIEDKVNDSERDDTEAGSSHVTNELKEDERNNTDEPDEMVQNFEVDEKPEEILSGNTVNETTPSIQNEEDPPEKDENINNETTEEEHITEVEASTVVTEVPAEEAQNSTAERSYDIDQSIPETASEQDNLPIASVGSETEAEKPETSDASSQGEVADSVIPETEDKSELEVEPKEKTDDEVTQKVEEVEELCVISHGTEELPEEDSTTVHEETSIEPNNSNVQQDLQTEESDANPTEAYNATDDISVEEGSEATITLISSVEQTDERSIDTKGTASIQEESNVQAPNEEAKIAEELEESAEQINECTDPSNAAEVELRQSETVAPETEILEVTPSEKLEDESNPTDIDAKSAESENTAEKPIEQDEVSSKPSNTRELQIDQTEFTAEQDQISEESEVKPTEPDEATEDVPTVDNSEVDATVSESVSEVENPEVIGESSASVDQIEDISVDKEESVVLQEDAAIAEEERQEIEPENEKHIKEVAEEESTIVHKETLIEPSISAIQQDLQTEESDANPIEPQNAADDISVEEGSEVNSTVLSSVEQTDDRSIDTKGTASIQEENNVQAPNEEADIAEELEESTEQIDHCIDPSNVAEVTPNTETLEVTPSQKLEDESNPTDIDAKLAESENTAEKSTEQDEVPTEPSNTRELQIDQTEFTAEQDQPSEESEVKPIELDQAAEDAPTVENSEVDAAVSESVSEVENSEFIGESGASVEQIEDVSVDKEESVVLQEEDAAVPEEEILEIEAEDEKDIEEDLQVTTPSEVTEVELNQTETVPSESEILEAVSNEVLGDDNKLVGTDINLAESESVTEEPAGEKEIPTEPNNARELQVGQAEIIVEQDQTSQESEGKPTELDQAMEVPTVENSTIDAAASESVEEIVQSLVVKEKSVLQDVATEMPEEEATNEKQIEEEVSQITNPSEVSEVELKESETLEAILNEGIDDESKPTGLDTKLAESESAVEEPSDEKEIPTEPNNARELQVDQAEIIVEQDQTSQESEVKPIEPDQAIEVLTMENSEVDAVVSESVEEIGERSVAKEESVVLHEEGVAVEMPEEEATKEKQIEEEVPQITNSSEVSEVKLNQSETVPSDTEIMEAVPHETNILEAVSSEELGDDNKLAGTNIKLAEFESTTEEPSEEKEIPTEPNNARELQVDQAEQDQPVDQADVIVEQDELSQELEVKPTELDQTREEVSTVENSEVDATVSERVEEIGEGVAAEMPEEEATKEKQIEEEVSQITNQSEYPEVKLNQSETVPPETEILEAIPHDLDVVSSEELGDDNKLDGTDIKLVEFESTTEEPSEEKEVTTEPNNTRELQVDQDDVIAEQDESSQELEVKPTELDQTKEEVPTMENLEVDAAVSESAEEIVESSVVKEKSVVLQKDVAVEMPEEEATDEKQIEEEVPQITDPSEVSEVELNQSEPVSAETEILKTDKNEELGDENKLAGTDINLAEFENATEEPSEEKDIPTELGSTRELQANQTEIIAEQDELDQESDVKPSESDLASNELSLLENSEVAAAVSEYVEGIGEDSSAKEECTILQEDNVAVKMPQVEAGTENQIKEEVPQITDPSEVSEVALNQSEPVPAETKILKTDKNEELGDENKLAGTDINLVKSEDTSEVPTEDKEVSTESNDTRELQIDQSEVTAEQDEPSQESDVKPTEPDQATEQVSAVEKSDIGDDTVTATVEESKEEKSVIFEEEDVAVEMPVEEATNEKEIKPEVTEVVHPSEITEEQLAVTENELKSDQMENYLPEGLTEEKLDAGVSSGVEQIHEKSEETEVLCGSTGEQVEGEETDAGMIKEGTDQGVEAAEEEQPCEKHIEGEIHITSNPETNNGTEEGVKAELTEKEVDPQVFKHQAESLEQEKVTEESASAEEKSEAGTTLVPGEMQTEETKSGILSQSVAESVTVPEEKISQEIEKNEEEIPTTADSEICDSVEVESNTVLNEKELDTLVCEAQPESPEKERETEESALPVENSIATAPSIPDEGQIEETEIANKEDGVLVQTMPESIIQPEEISQEVEANEEFSDKHIAEEIPRTADPAEVSYTAEEPKVILTEEDADSQKLGTETELPEQEETTEESTLMEEKSNATASSLPGDEPQSTAELVAVPEEIVSQEAEASEESSDQVVTGESMIVSNEEEVHSDKVITEIESPDLVTAAEELAEEKPAVAGNVVPGEGQVEEREIANKESCVAPETEGTVESVTIPEEGIQGIETDDEPTDKHIVGEEDKVEQAQITTSLVEQPDSKNSGTELESALVEKTNGEIDMKANIDEAGLTSFEGAIINQTDNESETVPVVEQIHAEDEEPKGHTERDIDATVFLKTPEIAAYETNEHTEDAVPNVSEQNKEVEEEANQSEEPEQGFASIVSSFLINKVLSEENETIDDATEQNNAASVIPKTSDDEMIQEVTKTKNEPETRDEDVPYATSSTEDLKPKQEQEEESAVKEVREDEQVDGVEQDYLPVSRFLMDKILRQEETKYPEKEAETIEEPDKHVISDGGIQVQEEFEESSTLVVAPPEKNADPPSSYSEMARDLETGKTLMISEVENTSITDGAISSEEKIENTISVEKLPKQGEGNHSPKEVAGDLEKVEKPADEALVSDVGSPSVEVSKGEIGSVGSVAEQEGERSISPAEAMRDFDKEDARIEPKNEGIPIDDKVEEITGEKILYPVQVGEYQHEKPAEEKDETLDSKVTYFTEAVEDLACGEDSKDLVEETVVNAPEISEPQKIMEESETTVMQKEEEHKDEAVAEEETPKDVKNVEENYVFVEHEVNQPEETKEVLEEKVTDEVGDVAISNLEEKQTALSAEIPDKKRDMADSTENCPKVEQSLPDVPEVPMVTEIVKEHVGNEADIIHGEEQVKEVTGTVESFENKSQEKASEMEAVKMEKKSEEIEDEEQEEDEEEEESHQEIREAEITGGDPTVKSEAKETETKSAQKKSLNILSGVGLKVITFTKVKKAFTGKSFTKVKKAFTGKSKSLSPSAK